MFSLLRRAILAIVIFLLVLLIKTGDFFLWILEKPLSLLKPQTVSYPIFPKSKVEKKKSPSRLQTIHSFPLFSKLRFFFLGTLFSFFVLFLPLVIFIFLQDLPNPQLLSSRQISQTTKMYDRNGVLLYEIYANQNRTLVPLAKIPKHLILATIAIEDRQFYNHNGIDVKGIIRAFRETIVNKNIQGGSTITQQLIKSAVLTPEVSLSRKVKEAILAIWAERIYSKDTILEMYFNQVSYGGTAYGVEAASEVYFGKRVENLTLAESAFLSGLPAAPSVYSPFSTNPEFWKKRQREVLDQMEQVGFITPQEKETTLEEELQFRKPATPILAPHFVMYVRDFLIKRFGINMVERGGLNVVTTLDLSLQKEVERIVNEEVASASSLLITNGAALVTKPTTGEILAMVGSVNYFGKGDGNVNATTSLRQPGSTIKVVTYADALQKGFTAASILDDSPITYRNQNGAPTYSPVNYDGKFRGAIPLRFAFGNSLNIPAVKTLSTIGVGDMVQTGKKMGITTWDNPKTYGLSITLGAVDVTMTDLATVYGTIANRGARRNLTPILKITNYRNELVDGISQLHAGEQVIPQSVAFIISDILSDNNARAMEFGLNSPLKVDGEKVSVKTGTSDNKRDNWTIGYTPDILVSTWVGNFDNSPMHQSLASGITGAAPMWRRIMLYVLSKGTTTSTIPPPENIIAIPCQGRTEYFISGTEKSAPCSFNFNPSATPSASPTP